MRNVGKLEDKLLKAAEMQREQLERSDTNSNADRKAAPRDFGRGMHVTDSVASAQDEGFRDHDIPGRVKANSDK